MIAETVLHDAFGEFFIRLPGDDITDYLELVHETCELVVCRVEPADTLCVLTMTAQDHSAACMGWVPPPKSTDEERRRVLRAVLSDDED